jgi:hypothetical protein
MRWIRLWVDESINGTTFTELNAEHRGVWYTLLLLAAYSPKPGTICIADGVAYTREQLAAFTKLVLEVLNRGIEHLSAPGVEKITVNKDGTISICNWLKYQTEYDRQKGYRRGLQGKVTHKGDKQKSSVSVSISVSNIIKGLSQETWDDFKEHREQIKHPLTPNAEKRLLKSLARMVEYGEDAEEVVNRSIENSWRGLFPRKGDHRGGNGAPKPGKMARAAEALRKSHGTDADSATANDRGTGVVSHVGSPARLRADRR